MVTQSQNMEMGPRDIVIKRAICPREAQTSGLHCSTTHIESSALPCCSCCLQFYCGGMLVLVECMIKEIIDYANLWTLCVTGVNMAAWKGLVLFSYVYSCARTMVFFCVLHLPCVSMSFVWILCTNLTSKTMPNVRLPILNCSRSERLCECVYMVSCNGMASHSGCSTASHSLWQWPGWSGYWRWMKKWMEESHNSDWIVYLS